MLHSIEVAMILHKLPTLFPWKHNKTKAMESTSGENVPVQGSEGDLVPCNICGRTFFPASLEKHTRICEKTSAKKRKAFNSSQQRVSGTSHEFFKAIAPLTKNPEEPSTAIEESRPPAVSGSLDCGRKMNRNVQVVDTVKPRSSSVAMKAGDQCPSCGRLFGPRAYDRHVAWCKESKARKPMVLTEANEEAKERLRVRISYRAPSVTRRKTVKEKYQGTPTPARRASTSDIRNPCGMGYTNQDSCTDLAKMWDMESSEEYQYSPAPPSRGRQPTRCKSAHDALVQNLSEVNDETSLSSVWSVSATESEISILSEPTVDQPTVLYFNDKSDNFSSGEELNLLSKNPVQETGSYTDDDEISLYENIEKTTVCKIIPLQSSMERPKCHIEYKQTISKKMNSEKTLNRKVMQKQYCPMAPKFEPIFSPILESDRSHQSNSIKSAKRAQSESMGDYDNTPAYSVIRSAKQAYNLDSDRSLDSSRSPIEENVYNRKLNINFESDDIEREIEDANCTFTVSNSPQTKNRRFRHLNSEHSKVSDESQASLNSDSNRYADNPALSKLTPSVLNLLEQVINEPELEMLTLKDCKRLLQSKMTKCANCKRMDKADTKRKVPKLPKLPKLTKQSKLLKLPKLSPDGLKKSESVRQFKSTICTLPKIGGRNSTIVEPSNNTAQNQTKSSPNTSNSNYNPIITAEKQFLDLQPINISTPHSSSHTPKLAPISKTTKTRKQQNPQKAPKAAVLIESPKRAVNELPIKDTRDDIDFEMLENFINDNFNNDELMRTLDFDTISLASCSTKADNHILPYENASIDPCLINDFDNLSIPDNLDTDTTTTPDMLRQFPLAHSNRLRLEPLDHQQSALNKSNALTSSVSSITDAEPRNVQLMKKFVPEPIKNPRIARSRSTVDRYLNDDGGSESGEDDSELFPENHELYEEYTRYEQLYMKESQDKGMQGTRRQRRSERAKGNMNTGDSAYGSLSRNGKGQAISTVARLEPREQTRRFESKSAAGDMSANVLAIEAPPSTITELAKPSKVSKFCHECGNRYPIETAKFCVECGVKRLGM